MFDKTLFEVFGAPYKHRGRTPEEGFDCLGLVIYFYHQMGIDCPDGDGREIPEDWYLDEPRRLADALENIGTPVDSIGELRQLDLVCFSITPHIITHLGIVTAPNKFIHCLEDRPVGVDRLNRRFWARAFSGGRRLSTDGQR